MKRKVVTIANNLAERIKSWEGVKAIILLDETVTDDVLDPYFEINIDVIYEGTMPSMEKRSTLFPNHDEEEAFHIESHDHFVLGNFPVMVEYIQAGRIGHLIKNTKEGTLKYRPYTTNIFYRLQNSQLLYDSDTWFTEIQTALQSIPEFFWSDLQKPLKSHMEKQLSNLGAASFKNDEFYFTVSSSEFLLSVCSFLFALNKQFEPPRQWFYEEVLRLPLLPDGFQTKFDSFLRNDTELTLERKWELASLITKSLMNF